MNKTGTKQDREDELAGLLAEKTIELEQLRDGLRSALRQTRAGGPQPQIERLIRGLLGVHNE